VTDIKRESFDYRVLVQAPTGKDAELTRAILERAGVACVYFTRLDHLCEQLTLGAGAVLLPEEALDGDLNVCLVEWLARQPPWSDLPVQVLARPGADSAALAKAMEVLGNVTVLERPIRVTALVSAVRSALRGRRRQYQIRDHLDERERAEEALLDSRERLRAALDGSKAGTFRWNIQTNALEWDENLDQLFGLSPGKTIRSLENFIATVHPEDRAGVIERCERCARDGANFDMEFRVIWPDGSVHWLGDKGRTFLDGAGRPLYMAGMCIGITDRKRAEEEFRRSAELLRVLIDRSPSGFYLVDADFRISHVNADSQARAFQNVVPVVGRRLDEVMRILWPEPLASEIIAIFRHTLDTGMPYQSPGLVSTRNDLDGVESYEWQLERITLPNGSYGVVCYYYDTTRLRQTEQALRESNARFRDLVDNIPQLAWIADADTDGEVRWFNQNWFDYTGTTLEEMRGHGWRAVHHPDHAARVIQKFTHHVRAGLDWEDTFPLRGKDGQFRWFLSRMKVIRDESGAVARIFGTNTDITEQRETANELRRIAAELSEMNRRKNEFLAMLAHELRNPLAPIRNAAKILRLSGSNREAVQSAADMMERQSGQLVVYLPE